MATREYRANPGSDLIDAAGNGWLIAGLEINNPSGSWLRVAGIEAYVPPYTMGWTTPLIPAQQTVTVRFVDSPSGTPSELVGGAVVVHVSNVPLPASQGFPSGAAQSAVPGVAKIELEIQAFEVLDNGSGGPGVNVVPGVTGTSIVPLRIHASPGAFGAGSPGIEALNLRDQIVIQCWTQAPPVQILPNLAISPEAPFASVDFPIGTRLPDGEPLRIFAFGISGIGVQLIAISTMFYRTTVG